MHQPVLTACFQQIVISTIAFDSEEEGLAIANDTNYGA